MLTVILRGPALSESGYGVHTRQVARWLLGRRDIELYCYLLQWGNTPWSLAADAEEGLIGRIISRGMEAPVKADVSYQVQLPNEWDSTLAKRNIGVTAAVETDRCNPTWIEAVNKMDLVVVPSEHVKATLVASGPVKTPIIVIPESFHDAIAGDSASIELGLDTDFNFLMFGQLTGTNPHNDRKNTMFALKWLCEEFTGDSTTGVVIKTNSGRETRIDRQVTSDVIRRLVSEVRRGPYPRVHLLHGRMSCEEVAGLYRHPSVRALVAPTRGEGFGLPILEASASGLPVIATGWSGHTDFMKRGNYVRLDYDLTEIHETRVDGNIFVKGARWAEVREHDFKKKVSKFRTSEEIPRKWAADLRTSVLASHSFDRVSSMWDRTLE